MSDIKPIKKEGMQAQQVGDEFIVLDSASEQVHQLNITAGFIWEKCDGEHSVEEIAKALSEMFDISYEQALNDTESVLRDFLSKSLLIGR